MIITIIGSVFVSAKKNKKNFTLITNNLSKEQRMQNRIDALRYDLYAQENLDYAHEVLGVIFNYLEDTYQTYEIPPDDLYMSLYKVKEAYFYLAEVD
jgi:hypothetical protein